MQAHISLQVNYPLSLYNINAQSDFIPSKIYQCLKYLEEEKGWLLTHLKLKSIQAPTYSTSG